MKHAAIDQRGWLPIRLWRAADGWRLDWCHFGAQPLREPFFSDDVDLALRQPFNQAMRRETSLQALLDGHAPQPALAPRAFVFHISRCGSTLLAQMLARLDSHIVLSEPPPLDALLRAPYDDPAIAAAQLDALRALLAAYGQPRGGSERHVVIKLDAWNIFECRDCAPRFPTPRACSCIAIRWRLPCPSCRCPGGTRCPACSAAVRWRCPRTRRRACIVPSTSPASWAGYLRRGWKAAACTARCR
jgi:hypothetical protein